MTRYNAFGAFFLCTALFCLSPAFAQGIAKPKITNIPGGFFIEWDSPVELAAVNPGKGLTGAFEIMFDVPSVEFINDKIDSGQPAPRSPELVKTLANYWIIRGKPERAIPLYEDCLKQGNLDDTMAVFFQNNLAMLYSQALNDHAKGLEIVDKALETHKDNFILLDTKGLIHLNSGDPAAAIPPLDRAVELSCQLPVYCMHLGAALYQNGQANQARQHFNKARDALIAAVPRMTQENKKMFDDLQRALPPVGL